MQIALYCRVSTDRQETENQAAQLREFAAKMGWNIVAEYTDRESGGKSARPEFQRMFKDASQRKFDLLLFWSLDRLSREGALETLHYLQRLTGYGVGWRSFSEQYLDSTGVFREAVISILAVVAKQERIRLSDRTKAGLARARREGKRLGRPMVQFDRQRVASMRASGATLEAIAHEFHCSIGTASKLARTSA